MYWLFFSPVSPCMNSRVLAPTLGRKEVFQMQFTGNVQEIVEASSFWHDNGGI